MKLWGGSLFFPVVPLEIKGLLTGGLTELQVKNLQKVYFLIYHKNRIWGESSMSWGPGWFRKGWGRGPWYGPWPGRGPWSGLPPWERPGWVYGRGWCWWYYYGDDRKWLESYRDYLRRELEYVENKLKELGSTQSYSGTSGIGGSGNQ